MRTQWRTASRVITGKRGSISLVVNTSLDYGPLGTIAAWIGIAPSEDVLDGLRVLEGESARIYGERAQAALRRVS